MKIEPKHMSWIFEAAGEQFQKQVEEMETELMRHERFVDEPYARYNIAPKTRLQRMEEIRARLPEMRSIVLFCRECRNKAADKSAEEFAKAFKGMFKI